MFNKDEIKLLKEEGFEFEKYDDFDCYEKGDWSITKSKELVKEDIYGYEHGCRICLMKDYDGSEEYVLYNICDCGEWLCKSVEECLMYMICDEEGIDIDDLM